MTATCPICDAPFDSLEDLTGHLADVHHLVDDPGTTTTLESRGYYADPLPPSDDQVVVEPPPPPAPELPPPPRQDAKPRTVFLALSLALAIIAFGFVKLVVDSGQNTAAPPPLATTSTTSPTADPDGRVPAQVEADKATAQAAVLMSSDLPQGWAVATDRTVASTAIDQDEENRVANCAPSDPALPAVKGLDATNADADTFVGPEGRLIENSIAAASTPHNAALAVELFGRLLAGTCLQQLGAAAVPSGALPRDVTVGNVETNQHGTFGLGDDASWTRLAFAIRGPTGSAEAYFDYVAVSRGRFVANFSFFSINAPFPDADSTRYINAVLARLPAG